MRCDDSQYKCIYNDLRDECIDRGYLCDGRHDCVDGQDEDQSNCASGKLSYNFRHMVDAFRFQGIQTNIIYIYKLT